MSTKTSTSNVAAQTDVIDALLALTRIYFASAERLSELALTAARKTVEDCASVARDASSMSRSRESGQLESAFGQPAFERASAFSRSTFEIVSGAQQEAARVLGQQFFLHPMAFAMPGDVSAGFDLFNRGVRDLWSTAAANVTAAADAGSRLTADAESLAKRAA